MTKPILPTASLWSLSTWQTRALQRCTAMRWMDSSCRLWLRMFSSSSLTRRYWNSSSSGMLKLHSVRQQLRCTWVEGKQMLHQLATKIWLYPLKFSFCFVLKPSSCLTTTTEISVTLLPSGLLELRSISRLFSLTGLTVPHNRPTHITFQGGSLLPLSFLFRSHHSVTQRRCRVYCQLASDSRALAWHFFLLA